MFDGHHFRGLAELRLALSLPILAGVDLEASNPIAKIFHIW